MGDINVREGGHKLNSSLSHSLLPNPLPNLSVLEISHKELSSQYLASEAPGVLIKMQVIGSSSRCRELYYLGVGIRIFPFRSCSKMYTDVSKLSKAFHLPSPCLSLGLTISYLDSSSCLLTGPPSIVSHSPLLHLLSAIVPSSTMSTCGKSPWFPDSNSGLPLSLLSYEVFSLTLDPSRSHAPCPIHSPNILGPSPTFNSTARGLPPASNAISFFLHSAKSSSSLKPSSAATSLVKPLCPFLHSSSTSYSHRALFIFLLHHFDTLSGTYEFLSVIPSGPTAGLNHI